MGDAYWNRQPPVHSSGGLLKRPRTDYGTVDDPSGMHSAHDMHSYFARDDDHVGPRVIKDTKSIGSAYDRYLQSAQIPSLNAGESSNYGGVGLSRAAGSGMSSLPVANHAGMGRSTSLDPDVAPNSRGMGYSAQLPMDIARPSRETLPLPPDASSTLYVEGLPSNSTRREVAHIFRPFVGYKEVRLVSKESKHRGGDPLILCFVDFMNPACAATALSALQGYKMDEHDPDSVYLRLQFSKYPGPRTGSGHRGKR